MSKTITIKLKKAGTRTKSFSIKDDLGNVLVTGVPKTKLASGLALEVDDTVKVIILVSNEGSCLGKEWFIPVTTLSKQELAAIKFKDSNTASLWRHGDNPALYNSFYGCVHPYIIEYPFAFQYQDQIVQNIKDYTKAYTYKSNNLHKFDGNRRVQTDTGYFNKAVLYNDQQSSGMLELVAKPINNMRAYMSYPKINKDSKSILFTKSDNFYQFNTFWNIVKDNYEPLFIPTCESLSIDKEVNQENMEYSSRPFKKELLRAKDLKVRLYLDNRDDLQLISQFIVTSSQISHK